MPPILNTLLETPRFAVVEQEVTNSQGHVAKCHWVSHPGAVVILPLVTEDRVCLIRNHRLTVGQSLIELPAGTREPGEPPIDTARRELAEETGYRAESLSPLVEFFSAPGITNERLHAFVATGLTAGPPNREANEQIENLEADWDDVMSMARRGEIQDAKTLAVIFTFWYRR